jgi:hypothetical protein
MSQPPSINRGDFRNDELLSSFDPEVPAVQPDALLEPPGPIIAVTVPSDRPSVVDTLSAKLDEVTRELERSRGEMSAMRGELATIVAKVRDIERPVARNGAPHATRKPVGGVAPDRYQLLRLATLVLLVFANAILWRPMLVPSTVDSMQPVVGGVHSIAQGRAQPITAQSIAVPVVAPGTIAKLLAPVAEEPVSDPGAFAKRARNVAAARPNQSQKFLGTLAVQTDPAGAAVFINRQPVGETPLSLPALRAGSHLLWIERAGYQRWTRVVTVPADQVTSVSARLEPQ